MRSLGVENGRVALNDVSSSSSTTCRSARLSCVFASRCDDAGTRHTKSSSELFSPHQPNHREKTDHAPTFILPIFQVAYAAPSKALRASFVRPKAISRRGVVAMSAATDEIIEKMKTLTVSFPSLHGKQRERAFFLFFLLSPLVAT